MATLLIVDPQVDFHPGGSLAIPTANDDAERIATFLRQNATKIDRVVVTMDSHLKLHIAHPKFWINDAKQNPTPFTIISNDDVEKGVWKPRSDISIPVMGTSLNKAIWNDDSTYDKIVSDGNIIINIQEYALEYTRLLEQKGRFQLCIWPEHCIIGSNGHTIVKPIQEAIDEWSNTTGKTMEVVFKGTNILTEMYSAIEADVPIDNSTTLNEELCQSFLPQDTPPLLLVCGQALSHCVNYTTRDIVQYFLKRQKSTDKIRLLEDCTSTVPGFDAASETFVKDMKEKGVQILTSTAADVFS